jgi:glutathione S-transferase
MSSLKIYGVAQSRAHRTLWCAEELGLDYETVQIHFADGTSKAPEYLAINPNGKIPAIRDGEFTLWESMAINCYLAKKHAGALWPATLEGEALVLQWSFWTVAELEKPLLAILLNSPRFPGRVPDPATVAAAEAGLPKPLAVLNAALAKTPYLLGDAFTLADLNTAAVLNWGVMAEYDFGPYPHVSKWLRSCLERPASQRAAAR